MGFKPKNLVAPKIAIAVHDGTGHKIAKKSGGVRSISTTEKKDPEKNNNEKKSS